ncbi:MAG: DUF2007 domain-containing protein [Ignavibacteriae bacterium]|nr:DUF2007 domain-containing protein [Ignavibacteriota bacterium]
MNDENSALITVYATRNPAIIAIIKSLLDDVGIEYAVEGETLLGLVPFLDMTRFKVRAEDEELSRETVKDVRG